MCLNVQRKKKYVFTSNSEFFSNFLWNTLWRKSFFNVTLKAIQDISRKKIYISFRKRIFQCFFSFYFHVLIENEGKCKKYINFLWQLIFFSQNCINYSLSSVFRRINILSYKYHLLFSSEKRNICPFKKKVPFHRESEFFDDFLLISLFT